MGSSWSLDHILSTPLNLYEILCDFRQSHALGCQQALYILNYFITQCRNLGLISLELGVFPRHLSKNPFISKPYPLIYKDSIVHDNGIWTTRLSIVSLINFHMQTDK